MRKLFELLGKLHEATMGIIQNINVGNNGIKHNIQIMWNQNHNMKNCKCCKEVPICSCSEMHVLFYYTYTAWIACLSQWSQSQTKHRMDFFSHNSFTRFSEGQRSPDLPLHLISVNSNPIFSIDSHNILYEGECLSSD